MSHSLVAQHVSRVRHTGGPTSKFLLKAGNKNNFELNLSANDWNGSQEYYDLLLNILCVT